jgi:hypothetical protein
MQEKNSKLDTSDFHSSISVIQTPTPATTASVEYEKEQIEAVEKAITSFIVWQDHTPGINGVMFRRSVSFLYVLFSQRRY